MIIREKDEAHIRAVNAVESVWRGVAGDVPEHDYIVPDGVWYSLKTCGIKVGYLAFLPEDGFTSVHIGVLPEWRGQWVYPCVRKAISEQTGKLKVRVRSHAAYAMAYRVGFRKTGIDAGEWIDMELKR